MNKSKAINKINNLISEGNKVLDTKHPQNTMVGVLEYVDDDMFTTWKNKIITFLSQDDKFKISLEEINADIIFGNTNASLTQKYVNVLNALKDSIEDDTIIIEQETKSLNENNENCIFIGHGHSNLWKEVALYLKDELNLSCVNYFEKESHTGQFIGDALRTFQNETTFAIIVMTAEDETKDNTMRTRQNVIHETGFFQGKLGFEKVAILKQEGVETFSNIDGLQYIPFSENNIDQTFHKLQKMLKREGLI